MEILVHLMINIFEKNKGQTKAIDKDRILELVLCHASRILVQTCVAFKEEIQTSFSKVDKKEQSNAFCIEIIYYF